MSHISALLIRLNGVDRENFSYLCIVATVTQSKASQDYTEGNCQPENNVGRLNVRNSETVFLSPNLVLQGAQGRWSLCCSDVVRSTARSPTIKDISCIVRFTGEIHCTLQLCSLTPFSRS